MRHPTVASNTDDQESNRNLNAKGAIYRKQHANWISKQTKQFLAEQTISTTGHSGEVEVRAGVGTSPLFLRIFEVLTGI
jgi:methionyl-tRNA synthetase